MIRTYRSLFVMIVVAFAVSVASAQVWQIGTPKFGSFAGGPVDTVNLGNLNVHFSFSVLHKAGRGIPFDFAPTYDTTFWYPATSGSTTFWNPVSSGGWSGSMLNIGKLGYARYTDYNTYIYYCNFIYYDGAGTGHPFSGCATFDIYNGNYPLTAVAGDSSGYTIQFDAYYGIYSLTSADGKSIQPQNGEPLNPQISPGSVVDRNGNMVSVDGSGNFKDTLGEIALTQSGGVPNPVKYTYTSPANTPATVTSSPKVYTIQTNFDCPGVAQYGPQTGYLVDRINLPDGTYYSFQYELTPGVTQPPSDQPPIVTGRLASILLPTGGTISYQYTGAHNGIVCSDGSPSGLVRTTRDGTWTYTRTIGSGAASTTTVTNPKGERTVIQFQGIYETQRQVYAADNSLLETTNTCYNGSATPCTGTAITLPITQRDVTKQLDGMQSKHVEKYNVYGMPTEVSEYDFGVGGVGPLLRQTLYSYPNLGTIKAFVATVTVKDGQGNTVAQTTNNYDEGGVVGTTGTPQHADVGTAPRGNLTSVVSLVSGTKTLRKSTTYFDTGMVQTTTDVNGAQTTNVYGSGSCGNSFPTTVNEPLGLTRLMTWNCTGGVQTAVTDENGNISYSNYTQDPYFWRPESFQDEAGNVTQFTYGVPNQTAITANQVESILTFNNNSSVVDTLTTVDELGRTILTQTKQGPGATAYDTVQTDYDVAGCGASRTTLPFSAGAGVSDGSAPGTTTAYDALCRTASRTSTGGLTVSFAYTGNDVLQTAGPAPNVQKQVEHDGLGRISSVCEITSGGGSNTCGQRTQKSGYWTKYTYNVLDKVTSVTQNAQATAAQQQTRSYGYDGLGRLTSETNPETNNLAVTYTYDGDTSCGVNSSGDQVKSVDPMGNTTCYSYDALHRPLVVSTISGPYAYSNGGSTQIKHFAYDTVSPPSGVTVANAKGRLAYSYTLSAEGLQKTTEQYYSYSQKGESTDVYQKTKNSNGFYRSTASYWPNGALHTLGLLNGAGDSLIPALTYGVDGKGRPYSASAAAGQNPVTSVLYNTADQPTKITLGSADTDSFTYDTNTGQMTEYKFKVNCQTKVGDLKWNLNGTLQSLATIDHFNSANNQSCGYGYDDLGRLAGNSCDTWQQTFSFDPFGNVSKSGNISFLPGYDPKTNRYVGFSYDGNNGNLASDGSRTFAWDADGNVTTVNGISNIYDANGRMAEQNGSTQVLYSPSGQKLALANNQSLQKAFVPLPGGAMAVYDSNGLAYYRHTDWLGSSRLASTPSRTVYASPEYATYGEPTSDTADLSFTGQNQDTTPGLYDFLYRQYHPNHGRWISPDPAGLGAVDLSNPQTWNRYAYTGNMPLTNVDPQGLDWDDWGGSGGWGEWGGGGWWGNGGWGPIGLPTGGFGHGDLVTLPTPPLLPSIWEDVLGLPHIPSMNEMTSPVMDFNGSNSMFAAPYIFELCTMMCSAQKMECEGRTYAAQLFDAIASAVLPDPKPDSGLLQASLKKGGNREPGDRCAGELLQCSYECYSKHGKMNGEAPPIPILH